MTCSSPPAAPDLTSNPVSAPASVPSLIPTQRTPIVTLNPAQVQATQEAQLATIKAGPRVTLYPIQPTPSSTRRPDPRPIIVPTVALPPKPPVTPLVLVTPTVSLTVQRIPAPTPTVTDIAEQSLPSVVRVVSTTGSGSGYFVTPYGEIMTSAHVVGRDSRVTVTLHDGQIIQGEVVGIDEYVDLAVVRLPMEQSHARLSLPINLTTRVSSGETVVMVSASPDGGGPTVTRGVVSAVVSSVNGTMWVRMTAPIDPSNIGAPLLDRKGRVIGIATNGQEYDRESGKLMEHTGRVLASSVIRTRIGPLTLGDRFLLPQATPLPTPLQALPSTGNWFTWEEVLQLGYEEDRGGEPRILLPGIGPHSDAFAALHVDCDFYNNEPGILVYLSQSWDSPQTETGARSDTVQYIANKAGLASEWRYRQSDDLLSEFWVPFEAAAAAVLAVLLEEYDDGDGEFILLVDVSGRDYDDFYFFQPRGFRKAAEPVFEVCRP